MTVGRGTYKFPEYGRILPRRAAVQAVVGDLLPVFYFGRYRYPVGRDWGGLDSATGNTSLDCGLEISRSVTIDRFFIQEARPVLVPLRMSSFVVWQEYDCEQNGRRTEEGLDVHYGGEPVAVGYGLINESANDSPELACSR
jgi:hypothetical protein